MNLVEFLFALGAVTGLTSVQFLWTRFVYKLEDTKEGLNQDLQELTEQTRTT